MKQTDNAREVFIAQMEERLLQAEADAKFLRDVNKRLKKIDKNADELIAYSYSEWLDDYNDFSSDTHYRILEQDPLFNAIQDIYEEKIRLLKQIVKKIEG